MFSFHRSVQCALRFSSTSILRQLVVDINLLHHNNYNYIYNNKANFTTLPFLCKYYNMENQTDMSSPENRQPPMKLKEDQLTTSSTSTSNSNGKQEVEVEGEASSTTATTIKVKDIQTVCMESDTKIAEEILQEAPSQSVSKRALKRQARAQQFKEMKKRRKEKNMIQTVREEAGYNLNEFDQTSYYFENGLRKVYPYHFVFATHAKGRWVGRTLKNVLEKEFGFDDPADVDKAFHQGKIHVNGKQANVDYVVRDCDYISHQIHRHENPVTDSHIEILADTDDVVVINKPSSIPCHPCGRYRFNSVVFMLGKEMGYSNLRNIYRLDRLTSGVLVMGKTAEMTRRLEDQVVKRQVQKEYVCRVQGQFPSDTVTVDQPLAALSNKLRLQIVSPTGKSSQTTFTRLSYNGRTSVVKCVPHTGRTHQIRVHLQYLGHPIINDVFYNSDAWGPNKGKGGTYEISHDVVCSRILKKHQATQWEGGENPLFHQKLKEMKQKAETEKLDENLLVTGTAEKGDNDDNSVKSIQNSLAEENDITDTASNENTHSGELTSNENTLKVSKNSKLNGDNTISDSITDGHLSRQSETKDSSVDEAAATAAILNSNAKTSTSDEDIVHGGGIDGAAVITSSSSTIEAESESSTSTTNHRPGFDWTKWQVEASCDLCRKLTIDPRPRDLVMFLHAWKYEGPGWAYQTELPDWAGDDWADEDQFLLGSTTQEEA